MLECSYKIEAILHFDGNNYPTIPEYLKKFNTLALPTSKQYPYWDSHLFLANKDAEELNHFCGKNVLDFQTCNNSPFDHGMKATISPGQLVW